MTATSTAAGAVDAASTVERRLRPLYLAAFLQNVALWVPIEKLFMTSIGFDAAQVGVMAAVYAAVVPVLEVPSGILADRWSRRGVLVVANLALLVSVAIGGLSTNVALYMVAALFLGVFFAMQSGTYESIVYDTIAEETGGSELFEHAIGRIRLVGSAALVLGAVGGGVLAEMIPLRGTYFATLPWNAASIAALWTFREPRLHAAEAAESLREQVVTTYRAVLQRGRVRPIVTLLVLTAMLTQALLEFGPLWMVALSAPAILYGPHWAGLMASLGIGGVLGGRLDFTRPRTVGAVGGLMVGGCIVLTMSHVAVIVVVAQIALLLLVVAVSIPITKQLHDAVPSGIRAGVASGVGTLTWLTFLPLALTFGVISDRAGVHAAGWLLVGSAALTAMLLMVTTVRARPERPLAAVPEPLPVAELLLASFPPSRFRPADDPEWPGHWATPPPSWGDHHWTGADLDLAVTAIQELPSPQRNVITLRDVEGRSAGEVCGALNLDPHDEVTVLNQARGHVRARLAERLEEVPRE